MTDSSSKPGRIDLRVIDDPADPLQAERVIAAAMSRMSVTRESNGDVLATIVAYSRPLLAAAAAILLIAAGTLAVTQRRMQDDQPESVLATWAEASHVPSNGELLATFQGYTR